MGNDYSGRHSGLWNNFRLQRFYRAENDKHNFDSISTDGSRPLFSSLIRANNGLLYGLTENVANERTGTIFSYDISAGIEITLYHFDSIITGFSPTGSFIQASNGLLYGMTSKGGVHDTSLNSGGTIFSYDISKDSLKVIHNFGSDNTDGDLPYGSLIQADNGLLYGMSYLGGANDAGTIFSCDISTGKEINLHDFGSGTGRYPYGSLIEARNGLLYGMTSKGGLNDGGVIFSYDIFTGEETNLHIFGSGTDGYLPEGSLIQASNDLLYGMTEFGGVYDQGIIFSYDISSGKETDIHDFGSGADGILPSYSLIQASNGLLYGMTYAGGVDSGFGHGTIFSYDISTGTETVLSDFAGPPSDGSSPGGDLIEVYDTATGINALSNITNNIQLYPIPSSTSIHFSLTLQLNQPVVLNLYNALGQQVWEEDLGKTKQVETEIPVTNLANGVYILKVNNGGESVQKEVVVEK